MEANIIINNECVWHSDPVTLFGPDCTVTFIRESSDMLDVLVEANLFSSRSQARKNWPQISKRLGLNDWKEIPKGWTDFGKVGKMTELCIWNPFLAMSCDLNDRNLQDQRCGCHGLVLPLRPIF